MYIQYFLNHQAIEKKKVYTIYDFLKSISNISMTNKTFTIKKALKEKLQNAVNVWFDANKESFEVRLWADKKIAKYFYRRPISNSQRVISTDPDGSIELSVMVTNEFEIIPTVFYWIPNLLVLSPQAFSGSHGRACRFLEDCALFVVDFPHVERVRQAT